MMVLLVCGASVADGATRAQSALLGAAQGANTATGTSSTMSVASAPGLESWYAYTRSSALTPLISAAGPTNSGAPSINPNNPTVNAVLTADPGTWSGTGSITYDYQWQSCSTPSSCTNVGTDSANYTVASTDAGNTLIVSVMGNDSTGQSAPVTSGPTSVVPPPGPTNSSPPFINPSSPTVNAVLTADPGTWSGTGSITYDYQWKSCSTPSSCKNVGTDSANYTVASTDAGNTLVVAVTGNDSSGASAPVTSGPTSVVPQPGPTNSTPPSISPSNPTVGTQLTASTGNWTGSGSITYDYQWKSCSTPSSCTNVGTDSANYTVASTDAGNTLVVAVSGTDSTGQSAPVTSGPTSVVPQPPPPVPVNTAAPTISPSAPTVGSVLTATNGSWTNSPSSYSYLWQTCNPSAGCTNVGTNSKTYTVASSDIGNTLIVSVTASNGGGASAPATSGPTSAVLPPVPTNTGLPGISGTAAVGFTLTASTGSWTNSPTSYSYQWQSCKSSASCTNVGSNSNTYTAASSDAGNTLIVVVTATNSGGTSAPVTSGPTAAVVGLPALTGGSAPSISGTAAVGQTLTASPGIWSNSPSFTYQWQRCYQGIPCAPVIGRTTATYAVGPADVNAQLQVVVTASNAAGSVNATAGPTAFVPALPGYPTARYTDSILTPVPASGSPVTFTSSSTAYGTESITSSSWNFGDGSLGAGTSVAHTYASAGTYTVTLTVTQTDGLTAQYQLPLTVHGSPTSAFTWSPTSPSPGASVAFQSAASAGTGGIASYSWSFGDGGTSTVANPTHTYAAAGTYTVTLSVIQSDGLTATAQHSITVTGQSVNPAHAGPSASTAAIKRWLAHVLASSHLPRIGALLSKNGVTSKLSAPHTSGHLAITWYATVRHHKIVVARGAVALRAGFSTRVTVRLTASGRALLTRSRTVTITISDTLRSGHVKKTDARTLRVKR